jgi:hypothetical protein
MAADAPPRRTGVTSSSTPPPRSAPLSGGKSKRREAVKELLGIPAIPLAMMAAVETIRSPEPNSVSPYAMDVYTLQMYEDPLADAISDLADSYPVLGAVLDRIGSTTPFVALLSVGIAMAAQFAENHNALPDAMRSAAPSLIDRKDLAAQIHADAKARENGSGTPTDT